VWRRAFKPLIKDLNELSFTTCKPFYRKQALTAIFLWIFHQTVESKIKGRKDNKSAQRKDLYRSPLKNHTLAELILTPQSFKSDVFWLKYMHLNGTFGTMYSRNMAWGGTF